MRPVGDHLLAGAGIQQMKSFGSLLDEDKCSLRLTKCRKCILEPKKKPAEAGRSFLLVSISDWRSADVSARQGQAG